MNLKYSEEIKNRFPDLDVLTTRISGVEVERDSEELERFKEKVLDETLKKYDIDELKDIDTFRTYRDFFWDIDIDPTKTRPASEALVRRILQGKSIPRINTLVDSYNLASIKTEIPLAAFDRNSIEGGPKMRFAEPEEEFRGIGMEGVKTLTGDEIVIADDDRLIAIYPYRDSESTKITTDTENVLIMVCGVPSVESKLEAARKTVIDYVTRFCGGLVKDD